MSAAVNPNSGGGGVSNNRGREPRTPLPPCPPSIVIAANISAANACEVTRGSGKSQPPHSPSSDVVLVFHACDVAFAGGPAAIFAWKEEDGKDT